VGGGGWREILITLSGWGHLFRKKGRGPRFKLLVLSFLKKGLNQQILMDSKKKREEGKNVDHRCGRIKEPILTPLFPGDNKKRKKKKK